jgi:hypothetical protein
MIFGQKLRKDLHKEFNKMESGYKTFAKKYGGDIKRTVNTVNNYSRPILGAITAIQPEFAPVTGTIGATLEGSAGLSNVMFTDEQAQAPREKKPRLQR